MGGEKGEKEKKKKKGVEVVLWSDGSWVSPKRKASYHVGAIDAGAAMAQGDPQ